MKVVIFAGGLGTRMREETEFRPKPMVHIGGKPILWHIMKTYAAHGHTDFLVLTGYKSELISEYFYNFGFANANFSLNLGDLDSLVVHGVKDEFSWKVSVLFTGDLTPTGGRLLQAQDYVGDGTFLCTYGDGLADIDLSSLLQQHHSSGKEATVSVASPPSRFGLLDFSEDGTVKGFREKPLVNDWVNIGYFVFEPTIFELLNPEVALEADPLQSLASSGQLNAFRHRGFWQPMDTVRERDLLEQMWLEEKAPWKVW